MATNRAILMTAPGVAAIAVVRISGPAIAGFLRDHFSKPVRPSRAIHGILSDIDGEPIDDCVVVLDPAERFADLNLHGGAWVTRATLNLAKRAGFEVFDQLPIPLPDDAIDSTEMIDQEIEAYLPLATTELALRTLLAQASAWRDLLVRLREGEAPARLSSPRSAEPILANHAPARQEPRPPDPDITRILADDSLHWLLHPPRVAIVGAANVGKSTLANRLFAQERSITADVPGTTRDWVGEMANLEGLAVQLVDTPGIRETSDAIEQEAIHRSSEQIRRADLIVLVLDATRPLAPEQSHLIGRFPDAIHIINKVDTTPAWDLSSLDAIHTIATRGNGVDELMRKIRLHFGCDAIDPTRPRCWTHRQREMLISAA